MTTTYNYIKALHLIFVITWFAGLFYIPRLFIYQIEAGAKSEPDRKIIAEQLKVMARRLWYIITWPSAILAVGFALWLMVLFPEWLNQGWMQVKLGFVVLLIAYHLRTHTMFRQLQRDEINYSANFMRYWNEGATLILFSVTFLAILKNTINWIYGLVGILLLGLILMLGIRLYKRYRYRGK